MWWNADTLAALYSSKKLFFNCLFILFFFKYYFCRLNNLQNHNEIANNNPLGCAFVSETSETKGLPGTVVCGVCGAVRRYSFILQARKFGTFSCEPCRKFISRVLRARVPVVCASSGGDCIRPPVPRWSSNCPVEDRPPGNLFHSNLVYWSRCTLHSFKSISLNFFIDWELFEFLKFLKCLNFFFFQFAFTWLRWEWKWIELQANVIIIWFKNATILNFFLKHLNNWCRWWGDDFTV